MVATVPAAAAVSSFEFEFDYKFKFELEHAASSLSCFKLIQVDTCGHTTLPCSMIWPGALGGGGAPAAAHMALAGRWPAPVACAGPPVHLCWQAEGLPPRWAGPVSWQAEGLPRWAGPVHWQAEGLPRCGQAEGLPRWLQNWVKANFASHTGWRLGQLR